MYMILLNFNSGKRPTAAEVKRPNFYEILYQILTEYVQEKFAKKAAEELEKQIQNKLLFPEDGVYTYFGEKLYRLMDGNWQETDYTAADMDVSKNSDVLAVFDGYAEIVASRLKEAIIMTFKEAVNPTKMQIGDFIDIDSLQLRCVAAESTTMPFGRSRLEAINSVIREFFSEKMEKAVQECIWDSLFEFSCGDEVVFVSCGNQIGAMHGKAVKMVTADGENKLRGFVKQFLFEEEDVSTFMTGIYNAIRHGVVFLEKFDYIDGDYAYRNIDDGRTVRVDLCSPNNKSWYLRSDDLEKDLMGGTITIDEDYYSVSVNVPNTKFSIMLDLTYDDNKLCLTMQTTSGSFICRDEKDRMGLYDKKGAEDWYSDTNYMVRVAEFGPRSHKIHFLKKVSEYISKNTEDNVVWVKVIKDN